MTKTPLSSFESIKQSITEHLEKAGKKPDSVEVSYNKVWHFELMFDETAYTFELDYHREGDPDFIAHNVVSYLKEKNKDLWKTLN